MLCVFKYIQVIVINCYIGLQLIQLCKAWFLEVTGKFLVKASILYPSISPLATALPKLFCCCAVLFLACQVAAVFLLDTKWSSTISGCLAILNKGLDPCIRKDN